MRSQTLPGREPGPAARGAGPVARGTGGEGSQPLVADDVSGAGAVQAEGGAGETVTRRFPAAAGSVGRARRFVLSRLPDGCRDGLDLLALMVSELATNAVQHAATDFEVTITVSAAGDGRDDVRRVRVGVRDEAAGYPTPQEPAADAPHGRGLRIVESLADTWGTEVQRGRPGKTVWFSSLVTGWEKTGTDVDAGEEVAATAAMAAGALAAGAGAGAGPWPVPGVRAVLDGLRDAIVATDEHGEIHYANVAAEEVMGWPHGSLMGRSALDLVPESALEPLREGFEHFVNTRVERLQGRRLPAVFKRPDGSEVHADLVVSIFDHPYAGRVVVGIFRAKDDKKLQRWSQLDERTARDPGRCADRRPAGRTVALDAGSATRLGRHDIVGRGGQRGPGVPSRVDADARRGSRLRPGEGGRPDERQRGTAAVGRRARRAALGARPDGRPSVHDGRTGPRRAAERLRLPDPLSRCLRRGRQDAQHPTTRT